MPMTTATRQTPAPEWLAHRYDPQHDAFHLRRVTRAARRTAVFLTDEYLGTEAEPTIVRRADVCGVDGARINFIFHSAFCCSTLVANCYDRPGSAFALKEPVVLNDLVGWRHRGAEPAKIMAVLHDSLALLARPFEPEERCVIKPSNLLNGLAPAMMADRPEAGALLLYAPLPVFLGSIARKGLWGRLWVRELLSKQLRENFVDLGFTKQDYFQQTDLQVAAVGWLAQHVMFSKLAEQWPDRVRTLDSEVLIARPLEALTAVDALFGAVATAEVRQLIVTENFSQHAKFGDTFAPEDRTLQQSADAATYADEINTVFAWAEEIVRRNGITVDPPHPLLP